MAEGRTGRNRAYGDCLQCSERHINPDTPAAANRWARQHVDRNPGHQAHVTTERVRVFRGNQVRP